MMYRRNNRNLTGIKWVRVIQQLSTKHNRSSCTTLQISKQLQFQTLRMTMVLNRGRSIKEQALYMHSMNSNSRCVRLWAQPTGFRTRP